jgi:hypothetical protein
MDARHEQRVRWSLRHPPPLVVDRGLARTLAIMDAYFECVVFAYSDVPICAWESIRVARPDDIRDDEPAPTRPRVSNTFVSSPAGQAEWRGSRSSYVRALVRGAYDDVATAEVGNRNNVLARSAFQYGRAVGAGLLDETKADAALMEAAAVCGLPALEARLTIRRGLRAGAGHPLEVGK